MNTLAKIKQHQKKLLACRQCPDMSSHSVVGQPVVSKILMVGQAPGIKEPEFNKPFAWTAGKTLFKWFDSIGLDENAFRSHVYMSAICRCFPGKNPKGGDRVPTKEEVARCSQWLNAEFDLLKPELLIPVGKLAICQFMECGKLVDVIGQSHRMTINGHELDVVPLPHPSGLSTWHRMEPGKTLFQDALEIIRQHSAWQEILKTLQADDL